MTSSPLRPGATLEDELDYYKKQYEQLETDLADFQASSKELEEQLERDIEAAEKNERKLKEQVEKLGFETEEWKTKHKQAKAEANSAQNALQKEITTMRESSRAMQLNLRDIEVVNDDYERQARNTESSLEDLESKYNVAIERAVMLEEEIKVGEQEREALRIETQRLRDDYGDLKVESDITQEKLRLADETIERLRSRKPSPLAVEYLRAKSPASEASGVTPNSPTASTPPPKSDTFSEAATPPSPPLSDAPVHAKAESRTPAPGKRTSLIPDSGATPRQSLYGPRTASKHTRGPSMVSSKSSSNAAADGKNSMRPPTSTARTIKRPSNATGGESLPRSDSLYQIKALRGRMQKIEERVHSARSKLPPPGSRTPTGSPRTGSATGSTTEHLPASVTMRRSMKRPSGSMASSLANDITQTPEESEIKPATAAAASRRESHIKRLSYGVPRPASSAAVAGERPPSALDRPTSSASNHRPTSRTSMVGGGGGSTLGRPSSRAGARTPMSGMASSPPKAATLFGSSVSRPRSSMGGTYATVHGNPRSHRPSASVSELRRLAGGGSEDSGLGNFGFPVATTSGNRRTTLERGSGVGTSSLSALGTRRRQSGQLQPQQLQLQQPSLKTLRRMSTGLQGPKEGEMRPPQRPPSRRKMSDVGETY
ncbi:NADH:ubiquinone oxidoreductase [Recurvomyces mirabilis]|uniref:NADH:ubiquinone oxidoreductase n=1 Tax=Recurvomyces mirabilis TaxID=574656 RepID=A0AAE1C3U0_9PEZI|nr:NADH:ubiquinone oxidoreductase [Recurvomyces mirabilis]KAK5157033.1 NADH:ubiquinone oxidoreductase [Recurvomyces mirabilis]